jgi:DNA-binding transcriptional MocR family regulator
MIPLDPLPNLIDQVYTRILDAIVDRTLLPGQRITQNELAEKLGVSRQPVSHALHLLHRQGLVAELVAKLLRECSDSGGWSVEKAQAAWARYPENPLARSTLPGVNTSGFSTDLEPKHRTLKSTVLPAQGTIEFIVPAIKPADA